MGSNGEASNRARSAVDQTRSALERHSRESEAKPWQGVFGDKVRRQTFEGIAL